MRGRPDRGSGAIRRLLGLQRGVDRNAESATSAYNGAVPEPPPMSSPTALNAAAEHARDPLPADDTHAPSAVARMRAQELPVDVVLANAQEFGVTALGARLQRHRERHAAVIACEPVLRAFRMVDWLVQESVLLGGIMVPFVMLGTRGIVAVFPCHAWSMEDIGGLDQTRAELAEMLPGVSCQVVILTPGYSYKTPRWFYDAAGRGALVIGLDKFPEWLGSRPEGALSAERLCWLQQAASIRSQPPKFHRRRPGS